MFAPVNNDLPAANMDPKGGQEPVATMPDMEKIMPVSAIVVLREN